jgi:hypothetical protein
MLLWKAVIAVLKLHIVNEALMVGVLLLMLQEITSSFNSTLVAGPDEHFIPIARLVQLVARDTDFMIWLFPRSNTALVNQERVSQGINSGYVTV